MDREYCFKKEIITNVRSIDSQGFAKLCSQAPNRLELAPALEGEELKISLAKSSKKSRHWRVENWEVLNPSPKRTAARCAHFGSCGGCRLQHESYIDQCERKMKFLAQLFSQIAIERNKISPIIAMQEPWHYREKMQLTFRQDASEKQFFGMYGLLHKRQVIELHECHLFDPLFSPLLKLVRQWWEKHPIQAYNPFHHRGNLRTLTFRRCMHEAKWLLLLTISEPIDEQMNEALQTLIKMLAKFELQNNVQLGLYTQVHLAIKGQRTQYTLAHHYGLEKITQKISLKLQEEAGLQKNIQEFSFEIGPTTFYQPNPLQAQTIFQTLLYWMKGAGIKRCLDLFCGSGTLTLVASLVSQEAWGVEINCEAIENAKEIAKQHKVNNVRYFAQDVDDFLKGIDTSFDALCVDPPRAGLGEKVVQKILKIDPVHIFYISCNPKTQVQDLHHFLHAGYRIQAIQPVDQFPQTMHIENMVYLKKVTKDEIRGN